LFCRAAHQLSRPTKVTTVRGVFAALIATTLVAGCVSPGRVRPDSRHQLILISLDGFRWDYLQRPAAVRLRALAASGTHAERLVPSFPSKTFPNHYTLVTGLYPENHGIAANIMRDSVLGRFATGNNPAVRDARWYLGEPIWVTAQKQGVRAATYFWPGSEAAIGGIRPQWYYAFSDTVSRAARVQRVREWLTLPEAEAPGFIAVYFSDVDTKGHDFGPDAPQTDSAIARVDSAVGAIIDNIAALGATDRVNVVVVSDHGMSAVTPARTIALDDFVSLDSLEIGDINPVVTITPKAGREAYVYNALKNAHPHLRMYRKGELPAQLHYNRGAHVTPMVAIADEGWAVSTRAAMAKAAAAPVTGTHGYDPAALSMGALLIAAGPDIRRGVTVPPVQNVHVYSLLARLLHVTPAANDGSLDSVRAMLRDPRP
jgi:predicted AlkP superfamily pyrophosphatase or phosphodiesterase